MSDVVAVRAVRAMACANHSLQSYFFQKEFFGELIVFRHFNMVVMVVMLCYLKRLE